MVVNSLNAITLPAGVFPILISSSK